MALTWEPEAGVRGALVLLHGVIASAATWWQTGPALAGRGWRVQALDQAGHGASPAVGQPLSLELMVDHVADQVRTDKDLLVGHSLGAVVALAYAASYPARVRGLVLEDPPSGMHAANPGFAEWIAKDTAMARTDPEGIAHREQVNNPSWREDDVRHSIDAMARTDTEAVTAGLAGPLRWHLPDLVAAVDVPVLLLVAPVRDNGSALTGPDRVHLQRMLPADRVIELDGGHCLHRDVPGEWVDRVDAFADSVVRSPVR